MTFTILSWLPGSYSQGTTNKFASTLFLEGMAHYSFLIPHHREMWALTDGFYPIWELSAGIQTRGKSPCQYYRNYPQFRLTYLYTDFGNSKPLGVMHAVVPNIRVPLIRGRKTQLIFGFGLGAAHLSKKYHRTENYRNLAIGSHYNAAIQFALSWRIWMSERMQFQSGISMLHVSNGTVQSPNFGLNTPGIFVGLSWKPDKNKIDYLVPEDLPINKGKFNVRIMGMAATKQILSRPDRDFAVYSGSLMISAYYNNVNTFLIGLDAVYDASTEYILEQDKKPVEDWQEIIKTGVMAGHEWTFSRLGILLGMGYYLENKNPDDAPVYTKIGISYNFLNFAFVGINLRTHWAKADFLGAGIGFKF